MSPPRGAAPTYPQPIIANFCSILSEFLTSRGVISLGFLGRSDLVRLAEPISPKVAADYGLGRAQGALVAALPYDTTGFPAGATDPAPCRDTAGRLLGALGWFARSDWYGVLAGSLTDAARELRKVGPWSRSDFRVAVNSRLPEKTFAVAAGLGPLGRNSLLLERSGGPGCVLGVLLLPFEPAADLRPVSAASGLPGSDCGECFECVRACPTGALDSESGFRRERCIQYWASTEGEVPREIADGWRGNLYGCDLCLAACPRFRPGVERAAELGRLGTGLALGQLLEARDEEIRERLRTTALGLAWLSPQLLKRNALLAAASYVARGGPHILSGPDRSILRDAERLAGSADCLGLASAAGRVLRLSAL